MNVCEKIKQSSVTRRKKKKTQQEKPPDWSKNFLLRLPDLNLSSRALAARDLLCLELGRTAWEEAWILLSIDGSTPAGKRPKKTECGLCWKQNQRSLKSQSSHLLIYSKSVVYYDCAIFSKNKKTFVVF